MIQPDVAEKYIGKEVEISTYKMHFHRGIFSHSEFITQLSSVKITHVTKTTLTIECRGSRVKEEIDKTKISSEEFYDDRDYSKYTYKYEQGNFGHEASYYKIGIILEEKKRIFEVALSAIVYITETEEGC